MGKAHVGLEDVSETRVVVDVLSLARGRLKWPGLRLESAKTPRQM